MDPFDLQHYMHSMLVPRVSAPRVTWGSGGSIGDLHFSRKRLAGCSQVFSHAQLVLRQFQSDPEPVKLCQHPNWRVLFSYFLNILLSMTETESLRIGSHIYLNGLIWLPVLKRVCISLVSLFRWGVFDRSTLFFVIQ